MAVVRGYLAGRWGAETTSSGGTVVASYDVLTMVAKEWDA